MIENNFNDDEIVIRSLSEVSACRNRPGMYVGSVENPNLIFAEVIENAMDESFAYKGCDKIVLSQNLGGFVYCADNGRGLPISMSVDIPDKTQAYLAVAKIHAGSKFSGARISTGMNGCGSSITNFLSEKFVVMSKITQDNYDRSIPEVKKLWEASIKSKKELFYVVFFEKGIPVYEGALKKKEIEEKIWGKKSGIEIPTGFSTHILFQPDPDIFDTIKTEIPVAVIQNFLLIQEKFYRRKVSVWIDNTEMTASDFKPYRYEFIKTITPSNPELNPELYLYVTFEADPGLGNKVERGSVNGLNVNRGVHLRYLETVYEETLRSEYKIKHKYVGNGLKMYVLLLASEVIYDSQTKTNLCSISKVKPSDFAILTKEFAKIFRKDPDYWNLHVEKLNSLAASYVSLTAMEKAEKLKVGNTASALSKLRNELSGKLVDCTAGPSDRWDCELFLCEGLSAGSQLVKARKSTKYHAILPLRGRVVNSSTMDEDKLLDNAEMATLFKAIGVGLGINSIISDAKTPEEAYKTLQTKSRYGKLIISTDADADGSIIASSLLYTIGKFARFLIDYGMVFIAESPLIITESGKLFYPSDPLGKDGLPIDLNKKEHYRYLKGLGGSTDDETFDAFFNPGTRRIIQVTPENFDYAMKLVEDIEARKELLIEKKIITNPYNL